MLLSEVFIHSFYLFILCLLTVCIYLFNMEMVYTVDVATGVLFFFNIMTMSKPNQNLLDCASFIGYCAQMLSAVWLLEKSLVYAGYS